MASGTALGSRSEVPVLRPAVALVALVLLALSADGCRQRHPAAPPDTGGAPPGTVSALAQMGAVREGLVDVGGRRLSLHCAGTGTPTVLLEAGTFGPVDGPAGARPVWAKVQPAVAALTQVCVFDRANVGRSDPLPGARTLRMMVDDLHALALSAAGLPGPYVLVGHSFGGLIARLYAMTYPDEVVGMVLVDSSHEDQRERFAALAWPGLPPLDEDPPPGSKPVDRATSLTQVRSARDQRPLRAMPLVVLSRGRHPPAPPGYSGADLEAVWAELQSDLARLVPGASHVVVEHAGHYILGTSQRPSSPPSARCSRRSSPEPQPGLVGFHSRNDRLRRLPPRAGG